MAPSGASPQRLRTTKYTTSYLLCLCTVLDIERPMIEVKLRTRDRTTSAHRGK